ncbi:MAG: hypothetical protein C5B50_04735 [Verrucomicrobia bacterium]|nr:MAG: hypothetical protein C5B50_04735 [Verrucomicrobiota bacterium]
MEPNVEQGNRRVSNESGSRQSVPVSGGVSFPPNQPSRGRSIALLFIAAAFLLVGNIIVVYKAGLRRIRAEERMSNSLVLLQKLDGFLSTLQDAETGQRGYLLTGEETYLQPYRQGQARAEEELKQLQRLADSGQLAKDKVARIASLSGQKFAELDQTITLRREKGLEPALEIVRSNLGKQTMDQLRDLVNGLRSEELSRTAELRRLADRSDAIRTKTFIVAAVVNLAFLAWAFRVVSRESEMREEALAEASGERELLETTLRSIGDAVIVTDTEGRVRSLNAAAEKLTGWKSSEAGGQPLPNVFRIINEQTRQPAENPVQKVLRQGTVVGLANHTVLISKTGAEVAVDDSAAPIREPGGPLSGVVLVFRDVSLQRKAQEARARLAAIVQYSGDAIFTKNLDGIIQTWNASAERMFGYKPEEIIGKHVTILFPPDRLTEEDYIIGRLRQGQPSERLETVRVAKDGRHIHVSLSVSPLKDNEGQIIGASKIIHDITDLVAAREALLREKQLLATTLASIGDAVIMTDENGRVTFVNQEAERLTGWTNAEALNHPLAEVFHIINEETRAKVENPVEKVLRLGAVVGLANHTILIAKGGREIPIDDSAAPIREPSGPMFGIVLVFRDFTQHKQAEAKLRELSLWPAQNPAPVLRIGREGQVRFANEAALEDLREWNLSVGQPAPAPIMSLVQAAFNNGGKRLEDLSVGPRIFSVCVVPIPEAEYANVYCSEVTERRQVELALRQAHEQLANRAVHLENLVEERTTKLREMVAELQHVSYAISHDMRAPLRAMSTFATIVQQEIGTTPAAAPQLQDYCGRIVTAASRLDRLIQDSLSYTKAVLAEVPLRPVDLSKLVPELIETYPNLHPDKADIVVEHPLPVVMGEESLLTQCFSNLLGNAVKFVGPGVRPRIEVRARAQNGVAKITLQDNGIGIPAPAQKRLFGMFQRLTGEYEGTGIGLAIVRKVVERMGGKIGAESEHGKGSVFWVELRLAEKTQ